MQEEPRQHRRDPTLNRQPYMLHIKQHEMCAEFLQKKAKSSLCQVVNFLCGMMTAADLNEGGMKQHTAPLGALAGKLENFSERDLTVVVAEMGSSN